MTHHLTRPDDVDTIRARLAEAYYGTQYSDAGVYTYPTPADDIERYAVALNRAMEDLFKLVNYVDEIQEVNGPDDVGLVKGEVPYVRIDQHQYARLLTGASAAIQYLRKVDEWRLHAGFSKDPDHDLNVARLFKEMDLAENAMRLAHGMQARK